MLMTAAVTHKRIALLAHHGARCYNCVICLQVNQAFKLVFVIDKQNLNATA